MNTTDSCPRQYDQQDPNTNLTYATGLCTPTVAGMLMVWEGVRPWVGGRMAKTGLS